MTTGLEKSCSYGLLCAPFFRECISICRCPSCPFFPFGFEGGVLDLIV